MSKFTEYLKLIPKAVQNPDKILEGWLTDIKLENGELSEDEVKEIIRRRAICLECPFNSNLAQLMDDYMIIFGEHYKTDRKEFHCSCCGCPITKKTASLSSECGLSSNDKTLHLQLKWEKYKND